MASDGAARTATADIAIATAAPSDLVNVTDEVRSVVADAGIQTGFALVSSPHTTCAVIVNEAEPGFENDFKAALERMAPTDAHYDHNDAPHDEEDEAPNGYAHVRAAILSSSSVVLPVRDGALALGRWQRIFFVELDRARPRTCQITVVGRAV
ncbi:MAG TPA: secondary thiamine-phosphate synthase enzyme YjbQ [Actinomycetota bacterium]|nr:secondary thiamine-phosphate synthase enzyme YjbQ [Actinomycetota bacterium]